jgi:probable rRNA maturation factor
MNGKRFQIEISNQQDVVEVDELQLRQSIAMILQDAGIFEAEVSLAIVDDSTIWELNKQHLDHDYPTDVLSFLLTRDDQWLEGEVIVSADTAIREAGAYQWPATHELLLYVIHGTLHLVGYDDLQPEALQVMREREDHYLMQVLGVLGPRTKGGVTE